MLTYLVTQKYNETLRGVYILRNAKKLSVKSRARSCSRPRTGFGENVVVAETRYQRLEILFFW